MKDWERIRANRHDLTDYVIHFTRYRTDTIDGQRVYRSPRDVLQEILAAGYIRPTFAPLPNRYSPATPRATVRGPVPAVCLTEQPIWAVLKTSSSRYSGYGIAYHKCVLHGWGARPVIYGTREILGERIQPGEPGYEEGKDIFRDGLPVGFQYLWVTYHPVVPGSGEYPVDFTWEREWRFKAWSTRPGLPIALPNYYGPACVGAIIVEKDEDVPVIASQLERQFGTDWPKFSGQILSLETAKRELAAGRPEYGRIETWPPTPPPTPATVPAPAVAAIPAALTPLEDAGGTS